MVTNINVYVLKLAEYDYKSRTKPDVPFKDPQAAPELVLYGLVFAADPLLALHSGRQENKQRDLGAGLLISCDSSAYL